MNHTEENEYRRLFVRNFAHTFLVQLFFSGNTWDYDIDKIKDYNRHQNQSGAAEAWWAHNPQVPGSKPGSDNSFI
jgi:hypothetical protein